MRRGELDDVRDSVAAAVEGGATLREVEEQVLRPAAVSHDARDALWLYAWTLAETQRPAVRW